MGKILDAVLGRKPTGEQSRPARSRPDGSTIGLSTPTTIRGNTVFGPSGGRATNFATQTPSGGLTNVRGITQKDYAPAQKQATKAPSRSPFSSGNDRGGGGVSKTTSGGSKTSGGGRGATGPSGMGQSGRGTGSKKKEGGLIKSKNKPAAKKPGKIGQKARFAQTFKSFKKSK